MPKPQHNKENVLKWYTSLKETLKAAPKAGHVSHGEKTDASKEQCEKSISSESKEQKIAVDAAKGSELASDKIKWFESAGGFLKKYSRVNAPGVALLNDAKNKKISVEEFSREFSRLKPLQASDSNNLKVRAFINEYNSLIDGWKKTNLAPAAEANNAAQSLGTKTSGKKQVLGG